MAAPSLIELLETRIAPAAFVNAFVVTYTDVDGDLVKVKSSLPIFHNDLREFTFTPSGEGEELSELILEPSASGTDLTIKVIETGASGDGAVNVGLIDASGVDLRSVTVEGALERISVGDSDPSVRGIGLLHVGSLGVPTEGEPEESSYLVFGAGIVVIDRDLTGKIETPTPGAYEPGDRKPGDIDRLVVGGNLTGSVTAQGVLGKIKVVGDLVGSEYSRSGAIVANSIGKIVINGSVLGGSGLYSGTVEGLKGIGSVLVEGDIKGGQGEFTGGFIYGGNRYASFWLGGSLIGGSGENSGIISAKQIDLLIVNGSILGGSGERSGHITMYGNGVLGAREDIEVRILGDLVGGTGSASGYVLAVNRSTTVNVAVGGDVRGTLGLTGATDFPVHSGSIVGERLGQVKIGGSVIAAERPDAETQITSYAIQANTSIAKLKVGGSIEGTSTNVLGISSGTRSRYGYDFAPGIDVMTVSGSVTYADVSAGYSAIIRPINHIVLFNPDAWIGKVRINGDLTASSITAGIHPGADSRFGTGDDHTGAGEPTEVRSRIASIIVGGQVAGTSKVGDAFAIAAQRVNSMTIGGVPVPLTSELDTIQLAPKTGDVLLREHA